MTKIGVLSDTHGTLDKKILGFFEQCDEIWHAGDIGNTEIARRLENFKPLRAVFGNIDGAELRQSYPKHLRFRCEQRDVWITHIGGYPKRYAPEVKPGIFQNPPDIFVSGHSHILKVMHDKQLNLLHINPGAAGKSGFHKVRTAVRFVIDGEKMKDMEVLELKR